METIIEVTFDFDNTTPDELYDELCDIHKDIDISDISPVLHYLEQEEYYELCQVVKDFANDFNIICK